MKQFMESITYMVTSIAVLSLLRTLHQYWRNMPYWGYISSIFIGIVFIMIYIKNISQKDRDFLIKVMLIFSVLTITAVIMFKVPREILFGVVVASVAGLATYYNYYRMADYVITNKKRECSIPVKSPDDFYLFPSYEIEIDKYLSSFNGKIFEALREIKKSVESGEISVYGLGNKTYIRRWKK